MINDKIQLTKEFVNKVDGWLTDREGEFLYRIAKRCSGRGVIVEIGSWKGKSTIWLGRGSKDGNNVKIYAVDPHTGSSEHKKNKDDKIWTFEEFKDNMRNAIVDDLIVPIVKTSEEAAKGWNTPVEVLFIDGAHEYDLVKKDFLLWIPHLINGGIIIIHDTTSCFKPLLPGWPGPKKVAEKFIFGSRSFKDVGLVDTITYARKCENNFFKDRVKMKYVKSQKYFPDFIHLLIWRDSKLTLHKPIKSIGKILLKFI
jgi:predicted O-methyltransferase YrrM